MDPVNVMSELHSYINNDCMVVISVPNFGSFQAALFKSKWFHLDLPRHIYHFNKNSLNDLLERCGFKILRSSTITIDQNIFGFIQSTLNILPLIPTNHLYNQIKSGLHIKSLFMLLLYVPLIVPLSIVAIMELVVSSIFNKGACLTITASKK